MSRLCLVLVAALLVAPAFSALPPSITDLGTLGGDYSRAFGLSDNRMVTGYAYDASNRPKAVVWTGSGIRVLSDLPNGLRSHAQNLNDSGVVVGFAEDSKGKNRAVIWDALGVLRELTSFGSGDSYGRAINNSGRTVGYAYTNSSTYWGFYADADGVMNRLLGLPGHSNRASAVNQLGQIAGFDITKQGVSNISTGFVWTSKDEIRFLRGATGGQSRAHGLNDLGQAVGEALNAQNRWVPSFWDSDGTPREIGVFGTGNYGRANAINNWGEVVGFAYDSSQTARAFVWTEGMGLTDLNSLLSEEDARDWVLREAWDINESGEVVGWGLYKGQERAFLMGPTTGRGYVAPGLPAVALIAVTAAAGLLRRRLRS